MYNQPQKKTARNAALKHAVEVLTVKRKSGAIVSHGYVRQVRDELAKRTGFDKSAAERHGKIFGWARLAPEQQETLSSPIWLALSQ